MKLIQIMLTSALVFTAAPSAFAQDAAPPAEAKTEATPTPSTGWSPT